MKRRAFVATSLAISLAPLIAHPQPARKMYRIGWLQPAPLAAPWTDGFRQGLRELGYVEGKDLVIEYRWGDGRFDRLQDLATDLVRLNVDVIVSGNTAALLVLKRMTTSIPVVMLGPGDPVAARLIDSHARPGGNITGITQMAPELSAKRLELLKQVIPKLSRLAVLTNSANPQTTLALQETADAARTLGLAVQALDAKAPAELDAAFSAIAAGQAQALVLLPDSMHLSQRKRIIEFAAKHQLPTVSHFRQFVADGGLLAYGPDVPDIFRRGATFVDKIIKGAKPADLPVEQPTKFELVVNLKTAKTLGVGVPSSLLLRADEVIH
jgi:putative ABC transport system substrate-binding protein